MGSVSSYLVSLPVFLGEVPGPPGGEGRVQEVAIWFPYLFFWGRFQVLWGGEGAGPGRSYLVSLPVFLGEVPGPLGGEGAGPGSSCQVFSCCACGIAAAGAPPRT